MDPGGIYVRVCDDIVISRRSIALLALPLLDRASLAIRRASGSSHRTQWQREIVAAGVIPAPPALDDGELRRLKACASPVEQEPALPPRRPCGRGRWHRPHRRHRDERARRGAEQRLSETLHRFGMTRKAAVAASGGDAAPALASPSR